MSKQYSSSLHFADLGNISKEVYEAAAASAMRNHTNAKKPAILRKLFYLSYLLATNPSDLLGQQASIKLEKYDRWHIIHAERQDYRHKARITQYIAIDDPHEKLMWDYITDAGNSLDLSPILSCFNGRKERNALTNRFKKAFKGNLAIAGGQPASMGIPPLLLRHSRIYSLLHNKGYSVAYVYLFLGMKLAPFKQAYVNAPFRKLSQLEELMRLLQKRGEQGAQAYKLG
jgi:hypothetical protein